MKQVKYAIAGFGGIAENRIAKEGFALDRERFAPLDNAKLIGATDINSKRRTAVEKLGLKWYDSVDSIGDDDTIDAVFIATNNASHASIAEKLIQAKKHLIIEKPITTTIKDAEILLHLARKNSISLAVDHMMIYNSYNIVAREFIASGALGEINDIVLHMEFAYGYVPEEAQTWRCSNPDESGGPVGDVGSHCLYMAEFLLDQRITSLQAVYTPAVNNLNVENGAFIRFETGLGMSGSVRVSFSDRRGVLESTFLNLGFEVYGSLGTMRSFGTLHQLSGHPAEPIPLRLEVDDYKTVKIIRPDKVNNIYRSVIESHVDSIKSGNRMSGEDGLHNLKMILKVHESAKNNGVKIEVNP